MTEAKKVQAVSALRKCAKEHEKDVTYTGYVRVSDMCNDVADYVEELQTENSELKKKLQVREKFVNGTSRLIVEDTFEIERLKAQIEKMKCCGNCKHYVDDNCDLQCPHNCYNYDEWELKK